MGCCSLRRVSLGWSWRENEEEEEDGEVGVSVSEDCSSRSCGLKERIWWAWWREEETSRTLVCDGVVIVREVVRERVVKMMQAESSNGRFRVSAIFCFVLGRESEVWCGG